jgi:phosphoglycerate dehydrogenase-like enzyme
MKKRIFIDFAVTGEIRRMLEDAAKGYELVFAEKPVTSVLHKAVWDPQMATANIIFGQPDVDGIDKATQLQWLHISSSGITRYDNEQFRNKMQKRKIMVSNSALVYNEACAEHTLAFMLAQSRQMSAGLQTQTEGGSDAWHWLRSACVPLRGQTVLIVGYGAIGKRLAELLKPFAMHLTACRRKVWGDEGIPVITEERLPEKLQQADHVINILPESMETQHYFNAGLFAAFKDGAVFYNIGRGTTVDQDALLETLRSKRIKAAWLDVTDPEPLPKDHPLCAAPNCFITPHVAGGHYEETRTLIQHFLRNLERVTDGKPLLDRVI